MIQVKFHWPPILQSPGYSATYKGQINAAENLRTPGKKGIITFKHLRVNIKYNTTLPKYRAQRVSISLSHIESMAVSLYIYT